MVQMAGTRNYQSIGEVLVSVKTEFPDITISKIRFLEAEGLIEPERTPSGYRKFYAQDVDRLKSILRMQRDEYLPLKVIKERLLKQDADVDEDGVPLEGSSEEEDEAEQAAADAGIADAPTGLQMSIEEMSAATGVERDRIKELESFGIVASHGPDGAKYYDGDAYIVLSIVKDFFRFGIEPRHLTMYKHFADRESTFFESAGGAHPSPEEPRRPQGRGADPDRSLGDLTEVQASAPAREPARRPAERVSRGSAQRSPRRRAAAVVAGRAAICLQAGGHHPRLGRPFRAATDARAAQRLPFAVPAVARDTGRCHRTTATSTCRSPCSSTWMRARSCSPRLLRSAARSRASRRS